MKSTLGIIAFILIVLAPASRLVADDESDAAYRQANGMFNVVWMKGLLDDYNNGVITQSALMRELWAERPATMTTLYTDYGDFTTCFQLDLVTAETNGVIQESNGDKIFFDTAQYLDGSGEVISGYERTYNTATRANRILQDVDASYALSNCAYPPLNNQCCAGPVDHCKTYTGKRCKMNATGYQCVSGSTSCPQ